MESKQRDHENAMKEQKEDMDAKIARVSKSKIESYARVITPNGVARGGAHLRGLAPGQRNFEETLQR